MQPGLDGIALDGVYMGVGERFGGGEDREQGHGMALVNPFEVRWATRHVLDIVF